jgi:uncharacterized cofD-like protein
MKNIVTIGGGTGTFVVLSALKEHPVKLTAIVSMADDGGSTGILRDHYGVLPPGDVRRALVALSESSDTMRELFNYRFTNGGLNGHSFGNIFLSTLEKVTGSFDAALKEASSILKINGEVVPVTLDDVRLWARLADGKIIRGETNIDIPRTSNRAKIEDIWLEPEAGINPRVKKVLHDADLIVIGPGDLYTSIIPNLLVRGMKQEIKKSKAKKVYVCNLMTKAGETDGFRAEEFVDKLEKYLGKGVLDYAVFNDKKPSLRIVKGYKRERAEYIAPPRGKSRHGTKYVLANLLEAGSGSFVRHGSRKRLAKVILSLAK